MSEYSRTAKVGRHVRIPESALNAFIDANTVSRSTTAVARCGGLPDGEQEGDAPGLRLGPATSVRSLAGPLPGPEAGQLRPAEKTYAFGAGSVADVTTARVRSWRGKLLAAGVGEPSVVKAYQLLRALMNTAVDDELIRRNPCRIKGADRYDVPERPVLTVAEVFAVADAIAPRYRLLVLLAAFTTLRFWELAALRRRDVDLEGLTVTVRRAQAELQDGRLFDKAPKSAAGCAPSPSGLPGRPASPRC
ncbi:tyrosine-type recombinase/integrase [Streptomyces sp. SS1-1]|uniref:tyrosine-type recombinase/integrase n=1 Tax=Streptomyces sp. SS1-1 TaxID=2651869 RepID=UPI0039A57B48